MNGSLNKNVFDIRYLIGIMLVVYMLITGWVIMVFISELLIVRPEHLMNQWEKKNQVYNQYAWRKAFSSLKLAHHIEPGNPKITFDIACLYEWRSLQSPIWVKDSHYYRTKSINEYRQALKLRPTWGLAWASLAQNKFLNQEIDDELWESIKNSIKYSPWERPVQKKIIWLGIATWKLSSNDVRKKVKRIIIGSLNNPNLNTYLLKIAVKYRWENNLRTYLTDSQKNYMHKLLLLRS